MTTPTRYHPLGVLLHWVIAVVLLATLLGALAGLEDIPNDDPTKVFALRIHMSLGITVVSLMLIRLIVRLSAKKPEPATKGEPALDWSRRIVHFLLYFLVFAMGATGLGMAFDASLFDIVFQGQDKPLPADFHELPPRAGHGLFARVLLVLIIGHALVALWHQFVRKDRLFRRMWFGKRWE